MPITLETQIEKEKELANLLGWRNLVRIDASLMGTPVGEDHWRYRSQALVPKWTRDWNACGPLIAQFGLSLSIYADTGENGCRCVEVEQFATMVRHIFNYSDEASGPTKDEVNMFAIAASVTEHLQTMQAQGQRANN